MTPFKAIKCPRHRGVIVARIEIEPPGKKVVFFSTRVLWDPNHVLGGRAAEKQDETRLELDDERIARGAIPFVVTWCPKCSREFEFEMPWLFDEAEHSGVAFASIGVLDS